MNTFLENAQRIFDVAQSAAQDAAEGGGDENSDVTLLVRPDGSLHMIMESTVNPDSAAIAHGAQTVYRVSRSRAGVKVSGTSASNRVELSHLGQNRPAARRDFDLLLRDQPLYLLDQYSTVPRIATS